MKTKERRALDRAVKALERAQERLCDAGAAYAKAETLALSKRLPGRVCAFTSGMGAEYLTIARRDGRAFMFQAGDAPRNCTVPPFLDVLASVEAETRVNGFAASDFAAKDGVEVSA